MRGLVSCSIIVFLAGCPVDGTVMNQGSDPDALVGTWREVPPAFVSKQPDMLTIKADRSYVLEKTTGAEVGTYEADELTVTIRSRIGTVQHSTTQNYVLDHDQLLIGALLPEGETDGVVGTWHGDASLDLAVVATDLDVRADGTLHHARDSSADGHEAADGTWRLEAGDFVERRMVGTQLTDFHWKSISNRALGNPMFVRVR